MVSAVLKLIFLALLVFATSNTQAQKREKVKFMTGFIDSTYLTLTVNQENLGDSIFRMENIFHNRKGIKLISLKKTPQGWFIKGKSKWQLFFDSDCSKTKRVKVNFDTFEVECEQLRCKDGSEAVFKVYFAPVDYGLSAPTSYLLTQSQGIVAIIGHDYRYVRKDKINSCLKYGY